jgi:RimJ/RimL family protein N-acetyltransferase
VSLRPLPGARAPSIETERLVLRAHRPADLPDCAAMWGDPAVTRYIGGRPFTREQTWHKILRYAGLWSLLGYGYWAIEEKATHRFAGELGFADFKRDIDPSSRTSPRSAGRSRRSSNTAALRPKRYAPPSPGAMRISRPRARWH